MNMKNRKTTKKRLLAVLTAAAWMLLTLCAFIPNSGRDSNEVQAMGTSTAASVSENTLNAEQQTDSDSEDTPLVSVSSYEELAAAIDQAGDGAVIDISCWIDCPDGATLGNPNHSVILRRTSAEGRLTFNGTDSKSYVQNITFDGNGILSFYSFVSSVASSLTLEDCKLINCNSSSDGAIRTAGGKISLIGCLFDNNTADSGAHLRIDGDGAIIENCTFTNGYARYYGGAIFSHGRDGLTLSGCVITGNTADLYGGGIYNYSRILNISQSKIHGNTAGSEADDIALPPSSGVPKFDDYQDVVRLYEPDGLFPNDWETREFIEDIMIPDPGTVYYRTFSERNHEQEPSSVTLNHSELTLNIGGSDTLVATLQPESAAGSVEWNSSNSAVASVDDSGLVTAISIGTASITATATSGDVSATCLVTVLPNRYTIDVEANPPQGGTVNGGGDYEDGASVTVTASPKDGFRFLEWAENGGQVSTDAGYTFTASRNRKLVAVFEAVSHPVYNIELSATQGGTASGGGNYEYGATVTICATPDEGYRFLYWTENGVQVSTENTYSFAADSDKALTAVFEAITSPDPDPVYEIHVTAAQGGTATGGGSFAEGDSVTVQAIPNNGYRFLYWTEDNQPVSTEPDYSFPAEKSRVLTAVFELIPIPVYSINITSTAGGTVTGGGQYAQGEAVTISAIPDNGYRFISWQENGITVSDMSSFSFTADADRALTAIFEPAISPDQTDDSKTESNSDELAANVRTDVPCSVTGVIIFYDENGQMISAVSQDQFDLAANDSFTLSAIAPQNWHTWKIFVLAEGTSGSHPELFDASYIVSLLQP